MGKRYDFVEEGKKSERIYSKIGLVAGIVGFVGFIGGIYLMYFVAFRNPLAGVDFSAVFAGVAGLFTSVYALVIGVLCFSEHRTKGMAIGAAILSVATIVLDTIVVLSAL